MICSKCGHDGEENEFFLDDNQLPVCQVCIIAEEALAQATAKVEGGRKNDQNKLRLDLIPVELTTLLAAVYSMGAAKYGDKNWLGGMKYSRIVGAGLRHLSQRCLGEKYDAESGLPHTVHAMWNLGALTYYDLYESRYKEFDDITSQCPEVLKLFAKTWETKK
jgi:hypothetical protein